MGAQAVSCKVEPTASTQPCGQARAAALQTACRGRSPPRQRTTPPIPHIPHLEAARALRQVAVAVHPVQAVHVQGHAARRARAGRGGRQAAGGRAWRTLAVARHAAAASRCQLSPAAHRLSVSLDLRLQTNPISFPMSMPALAARVSERGRQAGQRMQHCEHDLCKHAFQPHPASGLWQHAAHSTPSPPCRAARTHEWPVEEVAVVGDVDGGLDLRACVCDEWVMGWRSRSRGWAGLPDWQLLAVPACCTRRCLPPAPVPLRPCTPVRPHLAHVVKPLAQAGRLVGAVEDLEGAWPGGGERGARVGCAGWGGGVWRMLARAPARSPPPAGRTSQPALHNTPHPTAPPTHPPTLELGLGRVLKVLDVLAHHLQCSSGCLSG